MDHDPQGSSLVFGKLAERAGIELPFVPTCARVSGFDVYIHDHPPGLAEAYPSRIAIVPTLLDAPSFLIHRRGLRHLEERGLIVVPVASRFRSDRKQQRDLVAEHFAGKRGDQPNITWKVAVLVGLAQVVAGVFPGTSRSAAAIFMAMLAGTSRRSSATEFVFLVGIPTMFAASSYAFLELIKDGAIGSENWGQVGLAFAAATMTGFIVVKWLLGYIKSHRYTGFAFYRIVFGALLLLLMPAGS